MLVNYFGKYMINTQEIKEKLKLISQYNTENASFFNNTFKNAIEYLFQPAQLDACYLIDEIPNNLNSETIVIYFDNMNEKSKVDSYVNELSKTIKKFIIVGNHRNRIITNKIICVNIKSILNIVNYVRGNEKIQFGFHINAINYEKYYYDRMNVFFLNALNALYHFPMEDLENDVEKVCTDILLDRNNFQSHYFIDDAKIELKKMLVLYYKILKKIGKERLQNEFMFYHIEGELSDMNIAMLNSISELIYVYHLEENEKILSYVYDNISRQMLEEAKKLNYCNFLNNTCVGMRYTDNSFPNSEENGCCNNTYKDKGKNCRYMKDDHSCSISSISCRVFTCQYLQNRGIDHSLWQYPLIDCVFKKLARTKIIYDFFTPKEVMMKKLKHGII
ncbi:MAG: hypothetical protein IJ220_04945 [Clostridia bacterium]|nr:hypothetical protein [Clostridia bacterium]